MKAGIFKSSFWHFFVGDVIGSGEAQERGIVGETPNLAAARRSEMRVRSPKPLHSSRYIDVCAVPDFVYSLPMPRLRGSSREYGCR